MNTPLADRIRPNKLEEVIGQKHLLGDGKLLRKIIELKQIPNMIFYGPPGTGKTTLANLIAKSTNMLFRKLNCTTASTSDIKEVFSEVGSFSAQNGILLYLDEIQYFNKKQQQTLLEFIENGDIKLIASTTENPFFCVYNAILSRSVAFEFKPVDKSDINLAVKRAFKFLENEENIRILVEDEVVSYISSVSAGDVRKAINFTEICVLTAEIKDNSKIVTLEAAKEISPFGALKYDKSGDNHYDILSAFQKSMRGSDPDAAIHYLARLLCAGDLISACRRLLVCACEDVGLAYPQIVPIVKSCVDIAFEVGLPEARIPLAEAVILVSLSPKSNTSYLAINKAMEDVKNGNIGNIPRCLQNNHLDGADNNKKGQFYKYPHDYPQRWVKQQYLPEELKNIKYFEYGDNKVEKAFMEYWKKIKE